MNRKITKKEIEELCEICENYGAIFYDVQIELVDHLASLIEEQWEKTPDLDFQLALNNAVSKFGKSNFAKVTRQKEKEVNQKYNILLWKYFIEFYKWPKLLITFTFTLGLFILLQITNRTETIVLSYSGVILLGFTYYIFRIFPKYKIAGKSGKIFLLQTRQSQINYWLILLLQFPNLVRFTFKYLDIQVIDNSYILGGLSFTIVFLSILLYANIFFLSKKIKEHFTEQFPEFAK